MLIAPENHVFLWKAVFACLPACMRPRPNNRPWIGMKVYCDDVISLWCVYVFGLREDFDPDNVEQEPMARQLLDQMLKLLHDVALINPNVVEKVKLQHIIRNLVLV